MPDSGIKLVWAGWKNDPTIGFSESGYKRWRDKLTPGTRMFVYETGTHPPGKPAKSTKSIVGLVEVTGTFEAGEAMRADDEAHDRVIPVRTVITREAAKPISLDRARELIDDPKWPRMGESWKPLTPEQDAALLRELTGA